MNHKFEAPAAIAFFHPAGLIATCGGIGLIPVAPGTWGSLAALPLAWLVVLGVGRGGLAVAIVLVFVLGVVAAESYVRLSRRTDPGQVVIDEVAGQWLVLCFTPLDARQYLVALLLFRAFDIAKPWPISWSERRYHGGFGVMVDDIFAAGYAFGVLAVMQRFMP